MVVGVLCTGQGLALCVFTLLFTGVALVMRKKLLKAQVALASFTLLFMVVYFIDWHRLPYSPSMMSVLQRPSEALHFFFMLIGSPFAATSTYAIQAGIVVLLFVVAGLTGVIWHQRSNALWVLLVRYPWLVITAIVMPTVMVGRVGLGVQQALQSRYVPMATLFAATTLLLIFDTLPRSRSLLRIVLVTSLFLVTLPGWYFTYRDAVIMGWASRTQRNAYRDCILVHRDSPESCDDGGALYPGKDILNRRVKLLRDHRMSFFAQAP
jgi:hypothetical protein